MKCNNLHIKELLTAYLENELSGEERKEVDSHLSSCSECLRELDELKATDNLLTDIPEIEPPANSEFRFHEMLTKNRETKRTHKTITLSFSLKDIAAAAIIFIIGTFTGFVINNRESGKQEVIANLENHVSQMRQMLMTALINKESASDRLKAVYYAEQISPPSPVVTNVLIETLNNDPNVNVRLAAADALQQFAVHPDVRKAISASLKDQSDPLIQIVLIKMLVQMHEKSVIPTLEQFTTDQQTHEMVKQEARNALTVLL
jgi:hypothetical protein